MAMTIEEFLNKCKVVGQDEYETDLKNGAPLVCMKVSAGPSGFADSIKRQCACCDEEVWLRPYNDCAVNILCLQCATIMFKAGEA